MEKLIVAQQVKKSLPFMEPVSSLLCSQETATGSNHKPNKSSPRLHTHYVFKIQFHATLPSKTSLPSGRFLFGLLTKILISHLFYVCCMPRPSHPPLFDHPNNIWWSINYEAPHHAIFSILLSLPFWVRRDRRASDKRQPGQTGELQLSKCEQFLLWYSVRDMASSDTLSCALLLEYSYAKYRFLLKKKRRGIHPINQCLRGISSHLLAPS
jgi:hypothetical protein